MNASAWQIIRAIRGPIMLIAFGTLMALNHTDTLSFERSWPVLIIVFGIFKLLERMAPRPVPPPWPQQPAGYSAGYPQAYTAPQPPPQFPQGGAQ
jgi:hypothetical protein